MAGDALQPPRPPFGPSPLCPSRPSPPRAAGLGGAPGPFPLRPHPGSLPRAPALSCCAPPAAARLAVASLSRLSPCLTLPPAPPYRRLAGRRDALGRRCPRVRPFEAERAAGPPRALGALPCRPLPAVAPTCASAAALARHALPTLGPRGRSPPSRGRSRSRAPPGPPRRPPRSHRAPGLWSNPPRAPLAAGRRGALRAGVSGAHPQARAVGPPAARPPFRSSAFDRGSLPAALYVGRRLLRAPVGRIRSPVACCHPPPPARPPADAVPLGGGACRYAALSTRRQAESAGMRPPRAVRRLPPLLAGGTRRCSRSLAAANPRLPSSRGPPLPSTRSLPCTLAPPPAPPPVRRHRRSPPRFTPVARGRAGEGAAAPFAGPAPIRPPRPDHPRGASRVGPGSLPGCGPRPPRRRASPPLSSGPRPVLRGARTSPSARRGAASPPSPWRPSAPRRAFRSRERRRRRYPRRRSGVARRPAAPPPRPPAFHQADARPSRVARDPAHCPRVDPPPGLARSPGARRAVGLHRARPGPPPGSEAPPPGARLPLSPPAPRLAPRAPCLSLAGPAGPAPRAVLARLRPQAPAGGWSRSPHCAGAPRRHGRQPHARLRSPAPLPLPPLRIRAPAGRRGGAPVGVVRLQEAGAHRSPSGLHRDAGGSSTRRRPPPLPPGCAAPGLPRVAATPVPRVCARAASAERPPPGCPLCSSPPHARSGRSRAPGSCPPRLGMPLGPLPPTRPARGVCRPPPELSAAPPPRALAAAGWAHPPPVAGRPCLRSPARIVRVPSPRGVRARASLLAHGGRTPPSPPPPAAPRHPVPSRRGRAGLPSPGPPAYGVGSPCRAPRATPLTIPVLRPTPLPAPSDRLTARWPPLARFGCRAGWLRSRVGPVLALCPRAHVARLPLRSRAARAVAPYPGFPRGAGPPPSSACRPLPRLGYRPLPHPPPPPPAGGTPFCPAHPPRGPPPCLAPQQPSLVAFVPRPIPPGPPRSLRRRARLGDTPQTSAASGCVRTLRPFFSSVPATAAAFPSHAAVHHPRLGWPGRESDGHPPGPRALPPAPRASAAVPLCPPAPGWSLPPSLPVPPVGVREPGVPHRWTPPRSRARRRRAPGAGPLGYQAPGFGRSRPLPGGPPSPPGESPAPVPPPPPAAGPACGPAYPLAACLRRARPTAPERHLQPPPPAGLRAAHLPPRCAPRRPGSPARSRLTAAPRLRAALPGLGAAKGARLHSAASIRTLLPAGPTLLPFEPTPAAPPPPPPCSVSPLLWAYPPPVGPSIFGSGLLGLSTLRSRPLARARALRPAPRPAVPSRPGPRRPRRAPRPPPALRAGRSARRLSLCRPGLAPWLPATPPAPCAPAHLAALAAPLYTAAAAPPPQAWCRCVPSSPPASFRRCRPSAALAPPPPVSRSAPGFAAALAGRPTSHELTLSCPAVLPRPDRVAGWAARARCRAASALPRSGPYFSAGRPRGSPHIPPRLRPPSRLPCRRSASPPYLAPGRSRAPAVGLLLGLPPVASLPPGPRPPRCALRLRRPPTPRAHVGPPFAPRVPGPVAPGFVLAAVVAVPGPGVGRYVPRAMAAALHPTVAAGTVTPFHSCAPRPGAPLQTASGAGPACAVSPPASPLGFPLPPVAGCPRPPPFAPRSFFPPARASSVGRPGPPPSHSPARTPLALLVVLLLWLSRASWGGGSPPSAAQASGFPPRPGPPRARLPGRLHTLTAPPPRPPPLSRGAPPPAGPRIPRTSAQPLPFNAWRPGRSGQHARSLRAPTCPAARLRCAHTLERCSAPVCVPVASWSLCLPRPSGPPARLRDSAAFHPLPPPSRPLSFSRRPLSPFPPCAPGLPPPHPRRPPRSGPASHRSHPCRGPPRVRSLACASPLVWLACGAPAPPPVRPPPGAPDTSCALRPAPARPPPS
ncbi:proline-rich protein 36-like [Indicator indicator]|uniref:proline-rich protein 36-like n=1 Tax=Indicator indicator TaxID=1002788 RepID=UPI0023DEF51C|nr:proline-rich protein 36-like [Indicator indicator]